MKNKSSNALNIMIVLGMLFLIMVMIFSLSIENIYQANLFYLLILVFQICSGAIIINNTVILTHKGFHFFMGLLFAGWGIMILLIQTVIPYSLGQCWPLFATLSGVVLLSAGLYKYRKIKFGYLMPAIFLVCMGIWYMLFSFKIIKVPFITVSKIAGPIFLFLMALTMVLFFVLQQRHKELVINDDEGVFSDEEIITVED